MAIEIGPGELEGRGGAVVQTSGGGKYAIFLIGWGLDVKVYKDIDSVPNNVGTWTPSVANSRYCHAEIDGSDIIHILVATDDTTDSILYRMFNTATDLWVAAEETAYAYTDDAPFASAEVRVSMDSNSKPHIIFVDITTVHGTDYRYIMYGNKVGAGWAAAEQVNTNVGVSHRQPRLSMCPADDVEVQYTCSGNDRIYYRRRNGAWGAEGSYNGTLGNELISGAVVVDPEDNVYRYFGHGAFANPCDIYENGADTAYNTLDTSESILFVALIESWRHVAFVDVNGDLHIISKTGAGAWIDQGVIVDEAGDLEAIAVGWQYNFLNLTGVLNLLFDDHGDVHYEEWTLPDGNGDSSPGWTKKWAGAHSSHGLW